MMLSRFIGDQQTCFCRSEWITSWNRLSTWMSRRISWTAYSNGAKYLLSDFPHHWIVKCCKSYIRMFVRITVGRTEWWVYAHINRAIRGGTFATVTQPEPSFPPTAVHTLVQPAPSVHHLLDYMPQRLEAILYTKELFVPNSATWWVSPVDLTAWQVQVDVTLHPPTAFSWPCTWGIPLSDVRYILINENAKLGPAQWLAGGQLKSHSPLPSFNVVAATGSGGIPTQWCAVDTKRLAEHSCYMPWCLNGWYDNSVQARILVSNGRFLLLMVG